MTLSYLRPQFLNEAVARMQETALGDGAVVHTLNDIVALEAYIGKTTNMPMVDRMSNIATKTFAATLLESLAQFEGALPTGVTYVCNDDDA